MSNYTQDQTAYMIAEYEASDNKPETVEKLAEELGKSKKSIVGKLSREGVYKRVSYVTKSGVAPITKVELVRNIASNLELDDTKLDGLEKAPKQVLMLLETTTSDVTEELFNKIQAEERAQVVRDWREGTIWGTR